MKKNNLKTRLRNPKVWLALIPSVMAFVYLVIANFTDFAPKISESEALNISTMIITALTALGVLVAPKNMGSDSEK